MGHLVRAFPLPGAFFGFVSGRIESTCFREKKKKKGMRPLWGVGAGGPVLTPAMHTSEDSNSLDFIANTGMLTFLFLKAHRRRNFPETVFKGQMQNRRNAERARTPAFGCPSIPAAGWGIEREKCDGIVREGR